MDITDLSERREPRLPEDPACHSLAQLLGVPQSLAWLGIGHLF